MTGTGKSVFLLSMVSFLSLSVHACMLDELPSSGGAGAGGDGAGSAGEGSDAAGASGESSGGAGAAGVPISAGAAGEGGAGGTGQGSGGSTPGGGEGGAGGAGMPDPPHPCDTPVCQPGAIDRETVPCGECSDTITRTRSCRTDTCTWGEWGAWSACAAECQPDHWRCCGTGKWEWCYQNTCRWTDDCEACPSGSCNCK